MLSRFCLRNSCQCLRKSACLTEAQSSWCTETAAKRGYSTSLSKIRSWSTLGSSKAKATKVRDGRRKACMMSLYHKCCRWWRRSTLSEAPVASHPPEREWLELQQIKESEMNSTLVITSRTYLCSALVHGQSLSVSGCSHQPHHLRPRSEGSSPQLQTALFPITSRIRNTHRATDMAQTYILFAEPIESDESLFKWETRSEVNQCSSITF